MRASRYPLLPLALFFFTALTQAQLQDTQTLNLTFTTVDVPGAGATNVSGINTAGDMVGWYGQTADSPATGFLFSGGSFSFFSYPGADSTGPYAINDSGLIAGTAFPSGSSAVGFLYNGFVFTSIRIGQHSYTYTEGIDDAGDVVGGYGDFGGNDGYERAGTKFRKVTPPGNYTLVYATAINNFGQIVGTADVGSFLYHAGKFRTIVFPGAMQTYAHGINDAGVVVGWYLSCAPSCADHGFVLVKGKYFTIDYPGAMETFASGVNSAGQLVGSYTFDQQIFHGFVTNPITAEVPRKPIGH